MTMSPSLRVTVDGPTALLDLGGLRVLTDPASDSPGSPVAALTPGACVTLNVPGTGD